MIEALKRTTLLAFMPVLLATGIVMAQPALATDLTIGDGVESAQGTSSATCIFRQADGSDCADGTDIFTTITNVLLFIIGAISVIMLIIGGIRYTVSGGDSNAVTSAKNTILYAIVGLIVAILAFAIINFVVGSLT